MPQKFADRRQISSFFARLFVVAALCSHSAWAAEPSQVAAEVNGVGIPKERIVEERQLVLPFADAELEAKDAHALDRELLERLIERELLLQEAHKLGVQATDAELQQTLAEARKQFASENDFLSHLADAKLDLKRFTAGLRADLTIERLLNKQVFPSVKVSTDDVRALYEQHKEQFRVPEEVRARQIFLRVDRALGAEQEKLQREKAESLLTEARADPAHFADIAKRASDGSAKGNGGDLGYFTRNQMPKEFADAAFALKPGELSSVVRTDAGFHIILVEDRRGGNEQAFDVVKERLERELVESRRDAALKQYVAELRKRGRVIVYLS